MNTISWFKFKSIFDATRTSVVGNAEPAGRSLLGNRIDESSLVVRFNQAQVDGFEQHVGTRTDLLICGLHPLANAPSLPKRVKSKAVMVIIHDRRAEPALEVLEEWLGDVPVFFSLAPDILPSKGTPRIRSFTSGVYGLYFLLSNFDIQHLLVAGFNFYDGPPGTTEHYWENTSIPAPIEHDLDHDKATFIHLLSNYSGQIELSPEVARSTGLHSANKIVQIAEGKQSPLRKLSAVMGSSMLQAGMRLRRWAEE